MLDSVPELRSSEVFEKTDRGTAKRSFTASTAEGLSSCDKSSISCSSSAVSNDVSIEFLNKRRRQWLQSASTIRCFEDKEHQDLELDSDVMFLVMKIDGMATEPTIVGASHNYIKELEYFRDEIVGYPVSHFLSKSQPEEPIWIDCLNWNLVYRREKGREFHVAQAGAEFKIGDDTLILGCGIPVEKCLSQLDLTIHRKLKAIARKVTADAEFVKWATIEYAQYVKEDMTLFPNRSQTRSYGTHNTFVDVEQQKQSLSKMLSKGSLGCLDLSISEGKPFEEPEFKKPGDNAALKDAKTYDDIEDPHADCQHPAVRPKNIGSICHPNCKKACQFFFFSYKGCNRGFQCDFCHEGHVSNRKAKAKAWVEKQNERNRERELEAAQWGGQMAQGPPMWYPNAPGYWPMQNDAMAVGFTPVVFAPAPEPVPVQCTTCTNCGCSGRVHSLQQAPKTILVQQRPQWIQQPQWQPEYLAYPVQSPAPIQEFSPVPVQWAPQAEAWPQWVEYPTHSQSQSQDFQSIPTPPLVQIQHEPSAAEYVYDGPCVPMQCHEWNDSLASQPVV